MSISTRDTISSVLAHPRGERPVAFWSFVAAAAVNVGANLADAWWPEGTVSTVANVSQYLLMPLLALALWTTVSAPRPRLVRLALAALAFSWVGDSAPDLVGPDAAFLVMMGGFLCAQVLYAVAFWPWRREGFATRPWALAAYGVLFVALVSLCVPGAGPLLIPVVIYGACLVVMAVLSTGIGPVAGIGGALFLVSDALIALREFGVLDPPASGFLIMATYIVGQLLLAEGIARRAVMQTQPPVPTES